MDDTHGYKTYKHTIRHRHRHKQVEKEKEKRLIIYLPHL